MGLQEAAKAAVSEADVAIANALASIRPSSRQLRSQAMSFLATKATEKEDLVSTFKVHVPLVDVPDNAAAGESIRALEQVNSDNVRHMFEQAISDMKALPKSVAAKVEDSVWQRLGLLRTPPAFIEEATRDLQDLRGRET